ncbi:helix-turn-helix domain-containing protein [Minwuia sp.]|uniref:helix-turn-helix domain-containing protein n=1 Tax=Minwuia sp. TaxID=2493630 RepID=UPI003A8F073B
MPRNVQPLVPLLTVANVAELENVSEKTIRRRVISGDIPVIRSGRNIRIDRADYEAWRRSRRVFADS